MASGAGYAMSGGVQTEAGLLAGLLLLETLVFPCVMNEVRTKDTYLGKG